MNFSHALWRLLKTAAVFVVEIAILVVTRPKTRPQRAEWLSRFCQRLLNTVDIHTFTHGPVAMKGAVVSNHLSFLDILTQASLRPAVFVAAAETRRFPVIGWLSMMAGTVYVERGAGHQAELAGQTMAKAYRDGLPIIFFPEGGTQDGTAIAPFKSGLLAQTLEAQQPVTVSLVHYELAEEDLRAGRTARHALYWQEQTLWQLIWRLCQLHRVDVHVRFAEQPVAFSEEAHADRKVAAVQAREAMLKLEAPVGL